MSIKRTITVQHSIVVEISQYSESSEQLLKIVENAWKEHGIALLCDPALKGKYPELEIGKHKGVFSKFLNEGGEELLMCRDPIYCFKTR